MEREEVITGEEMSVERGTAVGDRLRMHWIPMMPLGLLERQHSRRVRILGEDLVCYRDLAGTIGLIGDKCPHRYVSLEWGVAADSGLRCPYHGWCFDETGQCIDIPIGGADMFKDIALVGYPVTEAGGVLFAFLGDGEPPVRPEIASLLSRRGTAEISLCVIDRPFEDTFSSTVDLAVPAVTLELLARTGSNRSSENVRSDQLASEMEIEVRVGAVHGQRYYRLSSSPEISVSTTVTFLAPFCSVIRTGSRRVVRLRSPLDASHTLVMNHLSFDAHSGERGTTRAFEVGALDRYGAPIADVDASSDTMAIDDQLAAEFSAAQMRSVRAFFDGAAIALADDVDSRDFKRQNSAPELRVELREILEYTGFGSIQIWDRDALPARPAATGPIS